MLEFGVPADWSNVALPTFCTLSRRGGSEMPPGNVICTVTCCVGEGV